MKKVVHFWNICGIGGLLARYMDRYFNYESVAVDRGHADIYSHNNEKTLVWHLPSKVWLARCFWFSRKFDIIHVHSGIQWLKYYRMINPNKKIVIHLHGTKIRGRWEEWEKDLRYADKILVATPDLLEGSPSGTEYIPNPIEEDLIKVIVDESKDLPRIKSALHVDRWASDKAIEYAEKYGLDLVVHNRDVTPLPHREFLKKLQSFKYYINVQRSSYLGEVRSYEYYIDVKRDFPGHLFENKVLEAFSLTALEALGLGCKVINWEGDIYEELPDEFRSYNIAKKLNDIYEGMFE